MKPKTKQMHIDEVFPYWRNPREITADAVEKVRASIEEFGYLQPIVVDEDNVIIIGHTRYQALRKMDQESVEVVVADHLKPARVKELRILDNRTHETGRWDYDRLDEELRAIDEKNGLITELFPEVEYVEDGEQTFEDFEEPDAWKYVVKEVDFVCPSCFHEWEMTVERDQIMKGRLEMTNETA